MEEKQGPQLQCIIQQCPETNMMLHFTQFNTHNSLNVLRRLADETVYMKYIVVN